MFLDPLIPLPHQFYSLSWDSRFQPQKDADGDGLLSLAHYGNDPDDRKWDTDGDGLSDQYELRMRAAGVQNGGANISPLSFDRPLGRFLYTSTRRETRATGNPNISCRIMSSILWETVSCHPAQALGHRYGA